MGLWFSILALGRVLGTNSHIFILNYIWTNLKCCLDQSWGIVLVVYLWKPNTFIFKNKIWMGRYLCIKPKKADILQPHLLIWLRCTDKIIIWESFTQRMLITAQTFPYLVLAETAKQSRLTELEKVHPGVGCKKVACSQNNDTNRKNSLGKPLSFWLN